MGYKLNNKKWNRPFHFWNGSHNYNLSCYVKQVTHLFFQIWKSRSGYHSNTFIRIITLWITSRDVRNTYKDLAVGCFPKIIQMQFRFNPAAPSSLVGETQKCYFLKITFFIAPSAGQLHAIFLFSCMVIFLF